MKDIDYILEQYVGEGGFGQWFIVLALFPVGFCSGFPLLIHMFAAHEPRHRCYVPQCDTDPDTDDFLPAWISWAIPDNSNMKEMLKVDEDYDSCTMFERIGDGCSVDAFNKSSIVPCQEGWVYENVPFEETLTTKIDLVCAGGETRRRFLSSIMMIGLLIGSILGGRLGDKYGRRFMMLCATIIIIPIVTFAGYSRDYITYGILRLLACTAVPWIWICSHNLAMEIFGPDQRKSVVILKDLFWPASQVFAVAIYYFNRHWTYMHIWTGVISASALPCLLLVPESARWLAVNGKSKEAKDVLLRIAKLNGKKLDDDQILEMSEILTQVEKDAYEQQGHEHLNPLDMFKRKHIANTLIMICNWVTINLAAYTLLLNSTRLYGDLFVNYFLATITGDLPGTLTLIFTLKYLGRRLNLFWTQFVLGSCCMILAFLPKQHNILVIVIYLIGKSAGGAAFEMIYLITSELYPTNLRSQALGVCSTVARLFGLVAPFVAQLSSLWKPLPMLVLGLPSLIAGIMVFWLPETKNIHLPQTMKQATNIGVHDQESSADEEK